MPISTAERAPGRNPGRNRNSGPMSRFVLPITEVLVVAECWQAEPDAEAVIQRLTRFTRPVNYLGLPSLAIPSGFTKAGLPVGMQLIGRSFDEAMLLRIGAAFQRATDFHARVPNSA